MIEACLYEVYMSYKRLISEMQGIAASLDMDFVMNEVRTLTDIEYPQTFAARANAAAYVRDLLLREGFDGVEKIDFALDGFQPTPLQVKLQPTLSLSYTGI